MIQSTIVPYRVFQALSPGPGHSVKVRVKDRADIPSQPPNADITFTFDLPSPRP
jgi:hypothetical protein